MRLSFDADHLRRLLDLSRVAERRVPALEQVLDPALWSDDLPDARIALLEEEIAHVDEALDVVQVLPVDRDPAVLGLPHHLAAQRRRP